MDIFGELTELLKHSGPLSVVSQLVEHFRSTGKYRELFESLKMRSRIQLGLPAVAYEGEPPLTESQLDIIERDLIQACREVGVALLERGMLEEGWMYMRPVGDLQVAREALSKVQATSENLDAMIQILVHEGVDVGRGTELCLQHRGTCNTITMLEGVVRMRRRSDQQLGVAALVRHVHHELLESVRHDLERRLGRVIEGDSIAALLEAKPDLLKHGDYHIDTSHLSATVRFARILDAPEWLRLALDLAQYGRELHPEYQYPGEEPFSDLYPASIAFFKALLGVQIEPSLRLFRSRAEDTDTQLHGTAAIETYVDLLARIGRPKEAAEALIRMMPSGQRPMGIAPSLLELCQAAKDFRPMQEASRLRNDLVGFAAAILQSATTS